MNPSRRNFWKFAAAAPVAFVADVVATPKNKPLIIESDGEVIITNCVFNSIEKDQPAIIIKQG